MTDHPKGHAQNPFTQTDIDAIKRGDDGLTHMPSGHYAARSSFGAESSFGARSSFGEGSSFGEWSSFGERCRFGKGSSFEGGNTPDDWRRPFFAVDRIGSEHRKAYFFSFGGVLHVRAGCFFGDEAAFIAKLDADKDERKSRHYRIALELARDVLGGPA